MDFMVDAFLCLVLDVFGLASIESAAPCNGFSSVGLILAAGAQRLRSRFTLLSRFAPRAGLVTLCQTFVLRCQNCVARVSNARRLSRVRVL